MGKNTKFLITGGPGFGKSSIIAELERKGICCIKEAARAISKENGLLKFNKSVIKERIKQYENSPRDKICFFDRGIPDVIAYLLHSKIEIPSEFYKYANKHKYYNKVFVTPPWKEIYANDKKRIETFSEAKEIHKKLELVYAGLGYEVVQIPKKPIEERVEFILRTCGIFGK